MADGADWSTSKSLAAQEIEDLIATLENAGEVEDGLVFECFELNRAETENVVQAYNRRDGVVKMNCVWYKNADNCARLVPM